MIFSFAALLSSLWDSSPPKDLDIFTRSSHKVQEVSHRRLGGVGALSEKIQIAALAGLEHVFHVQLFVAAGCRCLGWWNCLAPSPIAYAPK